jgi:hypothetical protein
MQATTAKFSAKNRKIRFASAIFYSFVGSIVIFEAIFLNRGLSLIGLLCIFLSMTALGNTSSIQDSARTAYTHGFETIYRVETIDLRTVRTLSRVDQQVNEVVHSSEEMPSEEQLELDLGPLYRKWNPSFVDLEPIQVVQFNKQLEKWLFENGFATIGALRFADFSGHRDEIAIKLKDYLKGKALKRTQEIDFISLMKVLFGRMERKKVFAALKPFKLEGWLPLTPTEMAEVKKMSDELAYAFGLEVREGYDRGLLSQLYERIASTWLAQWINQRGGIAIEEELNEVLVMRACEPLIAKRFLRFIPFPFASYLPYADGLYFGAKSGAENYRKVMQLLLSFFPKKSYAYSLQEIAFYAAHDLCRLGERVDLPFIQKILLSSNYFCCTNEGLIQLNLERK